MTKHYCKETFLIDKLFVTFEDFKENNPKVRKVVEHNLQLLKEKTGVKLTGFYRLDLKEIVSTQKWLKENNYDGFELDKFIIKPMRAYNCIPRYGYRILNKKGKVNSIVSSINYLFLAIDDTGNPYTIYCNYTAKENRFRVNKINEDDDNLWDNEEIFRLKEYVK